MHHASFNYIESGTQAFGMADMSQFQKIHMDQLHQITRQNMP